MCRLLSIPALLLSTNPLFAQASLHMIPDAAASGDRITLTGLSFPLGETINVTFEKDDARQPVMGLANDAVHLNVYVPSIAPGKYLVSVVLPGTNRSLAGDFTVIPAPPAVKLLAVQPMINYPNEKGRFSFDILGENFSSHGLGRSYSITIGGRRVPLELCVAVNRNPCAAFVNPGMLHFESYNSAGLFGQTSLRLWTGSQWAAPLPIIFARATPAYIRFISLAVVGAILLSATLVLYRSGPYLIRGTRPFRSSLVIAARSGTYSLGKIQLLVWTAVSVFALTYLSTSRELVQGRLEIPTLPEGVVALLAISAVTSLLATLIDDRGSSKGSGSGTSSLADLVCSSNIALPERILLLIWTILGSVGLLCWIILAEPGTAVLSPVPNAFIYVSGISSLVYIAGKLVRNPGPIIDEMTARPDAATDSLYFAILGTNFSQGDLHFQIDDVNVESGRCATSREIRDDGTEAKWPWIAGAGEEAISLKIHPADPDWLQGSHTLRLINSDNQSADACYKGLAFIYRPLKPERPMEKGTSRAPLTLIGIYSGPDTKLEWINPSGLHEMVGDVLRRDGRAIEIRVTPGLVAGMGQLVITPSDGARVTIPVEVQ